MQRENTDSPTHPKWSAMFTWHKEVWPWHDTTFCVELSSIGIFEYYKFGGLPFSQKCANSILIFVELTDCRALKWPPKYPTPFDLSRMLYRVPQVSKNLDFAHFWHGWKATKFWLLGITPSIYYEKWVPNQGGQTTNLRVGPHSPGWDPVHKGGTPITRVGPRSPG